MSTERENKVVNPDWLRDAADDPCCRRDSISLICQAGKQRLGPRQTAAADQFVSVRANTQQEAEPPGSAGNVRRFPP